MFVILSRNRLPVAYRLSIIASFALSSDKRLRERVKSSVNKKKEKKKRRRERNSCHTHAGTCHLRILMFTCERGSSIFAIRFCNKAITHEDTNRILSHVISSLCTFPRESPIDIAFSRYIAINRHSRESYAKLKRIR